jgi:hypothetical protein
MHLVTKGVVALSSCLALCLGLGSAASRLATASEFPFDELGSERSDVAQRVAEPFSDRAA